LVGGFFVPWIRITLTLPILAYFGLLVMAVFLRHRLPDQAKMAAVWLATPPAGYLIVYVMYAVF